MKKSKHNERWPVVKALTELGWSREMIAQAVGCSATTIASDQNRRGGLKVIAPDRPTKAADRYAATFSYYLHTDDMSEGVKQVAAQYLGIDAELEPSGEFLMYIREQLTHLTQERDRAERILRGDAPGPILFADGTVWEGDEAVFSKRVDEWELSIRSANGLQNLGIEYIGQLVRCTERGLASHYVRKLRLHPKAINEVKYFLRIEGVALGMKIPPYFIATNYFRHEYSLVE
jgi:hypothetical protein